MSKVDFDGCEPVTRSPACFKSTVPAATRREFNYLPPKSAPDAIVVSPTTPEHPGSDRDEVLRKRRILDSSDEDAGEPELKGEDVQEEIELLNEIEDKAPDPAVHQKLDQLLNKKFAVIFRKIEACEKRIDRIEQLMRSGVAQQDEYWGFGNPRDLKPINRYYSMIDKMYSMIMDAVKFNRGCLRERDNR